MRLPSGLPCALGVPPPDWLQALPEVQLMTTPLEAAVLSRRMMFVPFAPRLSQFTWAYGEAPAVSAGASELAALFCTPLTSAPGPRTKLAPMVLAADTIPGKERPKIRVKSLLRIGRVLIILQLTGTVADTI